MNLLITGGAGFIGSNLTGLLLKNPSIKITCVDNFDPYYALTTKKSNILEFLKNPNYNFIDEDIRNFESLKIKISGKYDAIIHLAAKVGVRPSVKNPLSYTEVNIGGTHNMLELAKLLGCKRFIFASSSSVYGTNTNVPWSEADYDLKPANPYALSKITGELLGLEYSNLFDIQFTALRLFTVYGPKQRPDLAIYKFSKSILEGKPIDVYGNGESERDYTFVDDVINGFKKALEYSNSKYEILNLGNGNPIKLSVLISLLEDTLKKKAIINKLPNQQGDVPITFANIKKAKEILGYETKTNIQTGLQLFVNWFKRNRI